MPTRAVTNYRRKLSGVERYSLVINEIHRYSVDGIVVGQGTIELGTLQRAVATAAQANPGVRVRLNSFLGFTQWVDSGIAPEVVAVDAPHWDCRSEQGADFLRKRFDPLAGGAIADVMLVRASHNTCVIFRGLHAAMDGRSISHWMAEVFRALRGEVLVGGESMLTDFEVAARYRDQLNQAQLKKKTAKNAAAPEYISVVPPNTVNEAGLEYIWRTISIPKTVSNILSRAAVYLAQYARRYSEGVVGFTVPIDYRGLRVEANSNGNLTGYVRVHVSPDDTPRTIMQQLNQRIREYVDCELPLKTKPLRWIPINYMVNKLNKNFHSLLYTVNCDLPTGGLVSMGRLNPLAYSTPEFTAQYIVGIPGAVGKMNMVAVNLPDSTIVTFSTPKNYNHNGQIDRLANDFSQAFTAITPT